MTGPDAPAPRMSLLTLRNAAPRLSRINRGFAALAVIVASLSCQPEAAVAPPGGGGGPNVATQLRLITTPTSARSGFAFGLQPVVTVTDANGQVIESTAAVTVAVTRGTARLQGTRIVNAVAGVAAFTDLRVDGGGDFTLTFSAVGLAEASFSLTATQVPATLGVLTQPEAAETGLPFATQPTLRLLDDAGLQITNQSFSVTASISFGDGTLTGTATVTSLNGVARFDGLAIVGSGAHSLQFSSGTLAPTTSNDFLVAGVTHLVITQQPDSGGVNTPFVRQPVIELRGEGNTVMRGATLPVTAAVASGSGGLAGVTTVTAVAGVATFTSLRLSGKGPHSLTFTSDTLPVVTSASFNVLAPPAALLVATAPSGAVSGSAFTTQPVITITDGTGEQVTDATVPVTVTIFSGSGALLGTTTVNAVGGVASFTNLRFDGGGPVTLRFASPGLAAVNASLTVTQTLGSLAIVRHPNGGNTGLALTTQPIVRVLDQAGVLIANATTAITAAKATGTGTLGGTLTVSAVNGIATFTNLSIVGGGLHTLSFSTGATSVTSAVFSVAQTGVALFVATPPAGATQNVPFATQPVVQVRDGANGVVLTSGAVVTATIASGTGALIGAVSVAAVNGVATFPNLAISAIGAHSISFSSLLMIGATTGAFAVSGPPTALAVQTEPTGAVSGRVLTTQPAVAVRDAASQLAGGSTAPVTVAIASGTGTLSGTTTVNAVSGVATFTNLRLDGSGPHTLTFTSGGLTAASSAAFNVSQSSASLAVQTQPVGSETGQLLGTQPQVRVLDEAGQQIVGGAVPVTASLVSGSGALTGTTTVTSVNGLSAFTDLRIVGSGPHVLQFSSTGLISASSASFSITQTPVALGITTQPGGGTVGLVLATPPVIQIRDALNNLVTDATSSVAVSVASGPGSVTGTTSVNAVGGRATFTDLVLTAPGSYTLTFTSGGLTQATSAAFNVSAAATKLSIQTQPGGAVSGRELTSHAVVRVLDGSDNLAAGFTDSIGVAIASGNGNLIGAGAGVVKVKAVAGVATFPELAIEGSDAHTLIFTSGALTPATSDAFTVTQVPFILAVSSQPTGAVSGAVLGGQPVVHVLDHAGLRIMTSTLAVTAAVEASGSATATLLGTRTVTAVQGEATFTDLRLDGGGSHFLTFSGSNVFNATSSSITITQNATTIAMDRQPAGATSGIAFTTQPRVRVEDATQNVVLGATTAITASIASGTGSLVGTTTVSAVNGVATFANLAVTGGGSHTLTFTATGLAAATSAAFSVTQAPASLGMETQPAGAVSGLNLTTQPAVRIRDAGGLLVASATNTVTVSLAGGSGTLLGTTTATAINGIATFSNLRINGAGPHTLQFTSAGLTGVTSASVTVTQQAVALAVERQPGGAFSGVNFVSQPRVRILDNAGLQVQGATTAVTVATASGSGALSGTVTVNASNGLATFSGLVITGFGQHSLNFTSGGLTTAVSSTFLVYGELGSGAPFLIHQSCVENPTPTPPPPLRVFYVDAVNGDDTRTGTALSDAWRTLARANALVVAGDLVYMRGVFSGQAINPVNSGTATNKITYRALPEDSARITLGASGIGISIPGRSHIIVDGISITNTSQPFFIRQNASNIWLFNLSIRDGGSVSEINNSDDNWIDRTTVLRMGTATGSATAILIRNGADRNFITRNSLIQAGNAAISIGPTSATDVLAVGNNILQNDLDNPWGAGMLLGPRSEGAVLECNRIHNARTGASPRSGLDVDGSAHVIRYNETFQNGAYGIQLRGRTFAATAQPAVPSELTDNSTWGNLVGSILVLLTFVP